MRSETFSYKALTIMLNEHRRVNLAIFETKMKYSAGTSKPSPWCLFELFHLGACLNCR